VTRSPLILLLATRLLYPIILLASVWLLLRGHNAPGGGFIGGMVAVAGTALLAMGEGRSAAIAKLPLDPMRLTALGVLVGLAAGLPALALGQPFMTHLWGTLPLGFTDLKVSTVLVFDLGVYLAVWGGLGGLCAEVAGLEGDAA